MGRDIWVALERRDYGGEWYNCDLFMYRKDVLERIPFYSSRSSVLFDFLHTLEKKVPLSEVSEGTQKCIKKEFDRIYYPSSMLVIEKSTLDEALVALAKEMPLSIDDEYLWDNVAIPFNVFYRDLTEYLRVIFKNEDYCSPSNPEFRVVFTIW